jgi:NDP-sugar pyrophosphorylase family protein
MLPVVILAGGLGTRLVEVTGDALPKVLVPVAGRPFIDWKLDELARHGAADVLLLIGHHADTIRDHVGDGARFGLRVDCLVDGDRLLGTGGAIRRALPRLPDAFWVTYGDSLVEVDLAVGESAFATRHTLGLMTVWRNRGELGPSNALVRDGLVVEYAKQPTPARAEHIDYGMLILTAAPFAAEPEDHAFDLAAVLSELAAAGGLAALEVTTRFYDIGDPAALRETEAYLSRRGATPPSER